MASILDAFKEKQTEERVYTGKKIKVGIIGCGWIAEAHLKSYLKCEDVEVVAFADLVPGKAEAFAKANGVEMTQVYYLRKVDGYMTFVIVTITSGYTVADIEAMFN